MKKLLLVCALTALAAAAILAPGIGLKARVESAVLTCLEGMGASHSPALLVTAGGVTFDPARRSVRLQNVMARAHAGQDVSVYSAAEISFTLPWRVLPAFTPLRSLLRTENMLPVAGDITILDLKASTGSGHAGARRIAVDVLRAQGNFLCDMLDGQPADAATALHRMGADTVALSSFTLAEPLAQGMHRLSLATAWMEGWQQARIARMQFDGLALHLGKDEYFRCNSLEQKDVHLPEEALLRRLWAAAAHAQADPASLHNLSALGDEILSSPVPLVAQARATELVFVEKPHAAAIREIRFDWMPGSPARTKAEILGLDVPAGLLRDALHILGPALRADMTFENVILGPSTHQKTLTFKAAGLGDAVCSLTVRASGAGAAALWFASFSDISLTFTDNGLLAWIGRNISPDPALAATFLRRAAALPHLAPTQQNAGLRAALQTFADKPGTLEIRSLPGKTLDASQSLTLLHDPGSLFRLAAVPGTQDLEEQIRALNLPPSGPARP